MVNQGLIFDDGGGFELLAARFKAADRKMRNLMLDVMERETSAVLDVAKLRLAEMFPNPARMQAALQTEVTIGAGNTVYGRVFATGLPYLAIHEFGGRTAPHEIFPVHASVLAFMSQGFFRGKGVGKVTFRTGAVNDMVFAKSVQHPGSQMPERSYLRYALAQRREALVAAFGAAAIQAVQA